MISRTLLIELAVLLLIQEQANAWLRFQLSPDCRCTSAGGRCMHRSDYCASHSWRSGLCGGPSSRRCCMPPNPGYSGTCPIVTYTKTAIRGLHGGNVWIHQGFKSSMDKISNIAQRCGVTVIVTSSFRKLGVPIIGTIVPRASRSNHKIGHAIDMNLRTKSGWCNSRCLAGKRNRNAKCFTDRIQSAGLRWGGNFNDPVHIDDRLDRSHPCKWNSLFKTIQRYC